MELSVQEKMRSRIIPRLDIKGPNLVKGIHLEGLRVLGRPEHFARHYYEKGAEELLYMDTVASLYGRNNLAHVIEETKKNIFIPLIVGGGLRSLEDIQSVLRAGADKVALNTAALQRPALIREASERFGASTIVISIEAKKKSAKNYECYTCNGRVPTGINALDWAIESAVLGAGEILVTSIDREGTGAGFDIDLVCDIAQAVSIPVIACGGAGRAGDVYEVITQGHADAVSLASLLHYNFAKEYKCDVDLFKEGNINFLLSGQGYSKIEDISLPELKRFLVEKGIECKRFSFNGNTGKNK